MTRRAQPLALLLGSLLLASCAREPLPNVVLVTFDTTRYDRFGCTGDARARTPTVDALAARGMLFEHAYASVPITLPSHTTILSGLQPFAHGVRDNGRFLVPDQIELLPEILSAAGYDTAAFVSAFVLDPRYNLDQGFDVYGIETHRDASPLDLTVPQRPGAEVTDEALAWLAARESDAPFFLWAHYYDPHLPRHIEPPFDAIPDPYRAEIAYADAQLARLLHGVEGAEGERGTLVVFTADHGEGLGQHAETTHALLAYDSTLHVPLVIAGPGVAAGRRSTLRAAHVDLVPTILGALGLPVPEDLPGRDLLAAEDPGIGAALLAALGLGGARPDAGYFECLETNLTLGWAPLRGVRTARWKLTVEPHPVELYDVLEDPHETRNLADERPEVRAELERLYEATLAAQARPDLESERREIDLEEAEQLAALGYVEAAAPDVATGPAPDPRRFVAAHGLVGGARTMASQGDYDRAIETLETLAESPSVQTLVLRTLAPVYAEAGRRDEAVRTYRRYIDLTGAPEARLGLARTLLDAGDPEQALAELAQLEEPPPRAAILRARALVALGRSDEAHRVVDAAFPGPHNDRERLRIRAQLVIQAAPAPDGEAKLWELLGASADDPVLRSRLGLYLVVWVAKEQREEGLALLREAAGADPDDPELQSNLGWGLGTARLNEEARLAFEEALRLDPSRQLDRVRLARVLGRLGSPEEALALVRSALAARPAAAWADGARTLEQELAEKAGAGGEDT